jgi:dTDP-glucose 4,6-dehydratase
MSVLQIAEAVRDMCRSRSSLTYVERPVDDPCVRQPDITLARSALGWEPRVPLEIGLKRTIEWFRAHPSLIIAA